jgi:hypothetical protein
LEVYAMTKLSNLLHRVSTGWVTVIALVIFVLFTALVLPGQASNAAEETGGDVSPDTSLIYTPNDLYNMAEAYGPEGRAAYIRARFTFDLIWPIVYFVFLASTVSWLGARAFDAGNPWRLLNLVPVLGLVFDYLENIATSLVMARYPAETPVVVLLAPIFTLVKWIFVGGSFVVLVVTALVALWRRLRGETQSQ